MGLSQHLARPSFNGSSRNGTQSGCRFCLHRLGIHRPCVVRTPVDSPVKGLSDRSHCEQYFVYGHRDSQHDHADSREESTGSMSESSMTLTSGVHLRRYVGFVALFGPIVAVAIFGLLPTRSACRMLVVGASFCDCGRDRRTKCVETYPPYAYQRRHQYLCRNAVAAADQV